MRLPAVLCAAPILALAATGPARAACPAAADLAAGVVVSFANGDTTLLRRRGDGAVEIEERHANGEAPIRFRAAHGVYVFEEVALDSLGSPMPMTRMDVVFPQPPLTLPPPAPGAHWSGRTTVRQADGTMHAEIADVAFARGEPLDLGGCRYGTIDVEVHYDWGKTGGLTLRLDYLPELGAAVLRSSRTDGGPERRAVPTGLAVAAR
ncbi:hypothetical protein [Rubellimicrobium arenae]|uniref:hypothetical protein n=1 Tax=Rubellimicrobium arenae TaxID=2817372 RepID=UPI001B304267|nr:hypothetical protein [Rubellimicrobium arenae]